MKKIICIVLALLLIGAAAAVAYFLLNEEGEEMGTETSLNDAGLEHLGLLKLKNVSELEEYVQNNDLVLQTSDDMHLTSVGSIPISGRYMTVYFQADSEGTFYRTDSTVDFLLKNRDVNGLKSVLDKFCDAVAELLDIDRTFNYTIYASEGYELNSSSDESLQKVLDETAYIALSAIDVDLSYWHAVINLDEANRLTISFWHSWDVDEALYESGANIVLATPARTEE